MNRQSTTPTAEVGPFEWAAGETEVLLHAFFNSPGAMRGIVEVAGDDDMRHIADNATTAAFVGLPPERLRGRLGSELGAPPHLLRQWVAACTESQRSGAPVSFEYLDTRGGGERWVSAVVSPVGRTADGTPRFSYIASDVTERRRAEAAAREMEERLRTVVENSQDGINLLDLETGRYVLMSPTQVRLTGFTAEEMNDFSVEEAYDRVHPDDRPISIEQQQRIAEGRDPGGMPIEYRWKVKSGEYRWFSDSRKLVRDADGRPVALVGVSRDITEQKRAEEALRRSEHQFRVLIENVSAGVALIDETGRFSLFNQQFLAMFGLSRESDVKNVNDQDWSAWQVFDEQGHLLHVDEHPVRKAALTGRAVRDTLVEVRMPDGQRSAWLLVTAEPLLDENGRPERIICTYTDISARKRLENDLHATVSALEHANRVKDEFLATLSHELRTPLNAILGWSDMLLRSGLPPDVRRKALESIRRNAQAQAALISDILDVSAIITGKLRLEVRAIDLAEVVEAARASVQPAADAKGISIRTTVERGCRIIGDGERLQQVVWNLLSNSVKFTGRGGCVDVVLRPAGSQVEIEVRDDGAGIAPEFLPHVFERFRQADSSTARRQTGLGLGLAIVRSLAELHGGTVTARSEGEGKGAAFTVTLPVRAVADQASAEEHRKAGRAVHSIPDRCLDGLHVVVVDDQDEARELIAAVLERYAARVTTCSAAQEALRLVADERPDLLLADIGMPECDGYELIRRVRALPASHARTLPAIALTAYGGAHDRAQALSAGFWEHLAKPILPDALVKAVAAVAGRAAGL